MQNTNADGKNDDRNETLNKVGAIQQLEQILSSGLHPLYRRAYRLLGNAADAEDAVQDGLLAAYTHLNQFRGQSQVSTWLTTIVLNCARLQLRRRPRHLPVSLDESAGELQPVSVSERLADRRADGSEIDIEMALGEALANAVIHGNGDDSCKSVYVTCRCYMDGEVSITVRDQGRGFDSNAVPDPTLLENLLFTHGRGIHLMKTLMDEVSFEEGGSVVRMRKNSNFDATAPKRSE